MSVNGLVVRSNETSRPLRKSRTGCIRCKRRKVKCDEGRPQCQRCVKINVMCPGYETPQTRLFGLGVNDCFTSDFEKTCFDSFISTGTSELIEFQPSVRVFWQNIVPQLGQIYPAVRHATIAISILVEPMTRMRQASKNSAQDVFAIAVRHFNSAIRDFVAATSVFRIEGRLTSSMLFHILTKYLECVPAGGTHIRAADFFLKNYASRLRAGTETDGSFIMSTFAPIIYQNILDASTFLDRFQAMNLDCGNRYVIFQDFLLRRPSPANVYTLHETLSVLVKYAIGLYLQDFSDPDLTLSLRSSLDDFRDVTNVIDHSTDRASAIMHYFEMHRLAACIFANTTKDDETSFDTFATQFEGICDHAELLLQSNAEPFRVTLGLIPPLFLTATKCRALRLRQRALACLHRTSRVESAWTSCMAFMLARFVIECEMDESGRHITLTHVVYLQDRNLLQFEYVRSQHHTRAPQCEMQALPVATPHVLVSSFNRSVIQSRVISAAGYSGAITGSLYDSCHCSSGYSMS